MSSVELERAEAQAQRSHAAKKPYGHISLKVPKVKFDFDVSVAKHKYQTSNVSMTRHTSWVIFG